MAISKLACSVCFVVLGGGAAWAQQLAGVFVASEDPQSMYSVLGIDIHTKAPSDADDADVFVFSALTPPGGGVPPHIHSVEDETVFIEDGTYDVMLGGEMYKAGAGSVLYMPKGIPHAFTNTGDDASTTVWVINPGTAFQSLFADLAILPPGPPDIAKVTEIFANYGIDLLPPPQ